MQLRSEGVRAYTLKVPPASDYPSTIVPVRQTEPPAGPQLLVMAPGVFELHALPMTGEVVVGRSAEADVRIDDPLASRQHLRVRTRAGSFEVTDLASANGTRVGAQPLAAHTPLALLPGQHVRVGDTVLAFEAAAPTPSRQSTLAKFTERHIEVVQGAAMLERDPATRILYATARRASAGHINILLQGETGTGKDVLARAVHAMSPRHAAPFVAINCAALAESLLESELFGHERGAFTGASTAKPGLLESAPGGTVLLDEVGEMPLAMQAKLLTAIEAKQVTRVGSVVPRKIDLRFIAATHRDLQAESTRGTFRSDLYFRLAGMTLTLPPLRERLATTRTLAHTFAQHAGVALGKAGLQISPGALELLCAHSWPGNIRELRNVIDRAALLCEGQVIEPEHLPTWAAVTTSDSGAIDQTGPYPAAERTRVLAALAACAGNQSRAAAHLRLSRKALIARLNAFGIARPRKGRTDD